MLWTNNYILQKENEGDNEGSGGNSSFEKVDFNDPHLMNDLAEKSDRKKSSKDEMIFDNLSEVKKTKTFIEPNSKYENSNPIPEIKSDTEQLDEIMNMDDVASEHYEKSMSEENKELTKENEKLSENYSILLKVYDSLASKISVKYFKPIIAGTTIAAIAATTYISTLFKNDNIDALVSENNNLKEANTKLTNKLTQESNNYKSIKSLLSEKISEYNSLQLAKNELEKKYAKTDSTLNNLIANNKYVERQDSIRYAREQKAKAEALQAIQSTRGRKR